MKFYDLFSGIGGFRLPLERLGFSYVGSCEIDKYAREIYRNNFGEYPTEKDIRTVNPSELPDFDILTAGFPCQSFSVAGKRMGFNDPRGTMFFEIARIVKEKRPQTLLLENVKGLLSHNKGRTFTTIITTLDELGYDVEWQVINGKYFVPQNRERIFIIGHIREKPFRQIFPIRESYKINDKTRPETQEKGKWFSMSYTRTIDSNYYKGAGTRTMIAMVGHLQSNIQQRIKYSDRTWVIDTTGRTIGIVKNNKIRRLTPLECERLMGFPDDWTRVNNISDTQRYRCLGNAVIPLIIEEIAKRL